MKILFINNNGRGFADEIEVADGMTVRTFLEKHLGDTVDFSRYRIRVNGETVISANRVLVGGDRVTATPVKIEGGVA